MSVNGWDDADPVLQDDGPATSYELATRFTANDDITISAIRVWASATQNVPGRNGHLWTTGGSLLATVDIDDSLPTSGYTTYTLPVPVNILSGTTFDVSYGTTRFYGSTAGGYPNPSSDGNVTAIAGRYALSIGVATDHATANFYGIDIVYTLSSDNQAPIITAMSLTQENLDVTATITVTDEVAATVTALWDWGDGNSSSTGAGILTASHTYTQGGLFAVLVTVTDAGGLQDSASEPLELVGPTPALTWFDVAAEIRDALGAIDGLRRPELGDFRAGTPFAIVGFPPTAKYDATYRRGSDRWDDVPVYVVCGRPDGRPAAALASGYMAGSGDSSVKQAIEAYAYTAADSVTVVGCDTDLNAEHEGKPTMILTFHLDITGTGR